MEESLHNTPSCINIIQEVALGKTRATIPELAEAKRDDAPQLKGQGKRKRPQTPVESPRRDWGNHAPSLAQEKTRSEMVQLKHQLYVKILESKISKSMDTLPKLGEYGKKWDPDEHEKLVNDRLSYFSANDASKRKMFVLSLIRPT